MLLRQYVAIHNATHKVAFFIDFIDDQHGAYTIQEQQPQLSEKSDLRVRA